MGKYVSYTRAFKHLFIGHAEESGNHAAGRNFDVNESKCATGVSGRLSSTEQSAAAMLPGLPKRGKFRKAEGAVPRYATQLQNDGRAVSHKLVRVYACANARAGSILAVDFKASDARMTCFVHLLRSLLLLDCLRKHLVASDRKKLKELRTKLTVIPGGLPSVVQR